MTQSKLLIHCGLHTLSIGARKMETPVRANTRIPVILCSLCMGHRWWHIHKRMSSQFYKAFLYFNFKGFSEVFLSICDTANGSEKKHKAKVLFLKFCRPTWHRGTEAALREHLTRSPSSKSQCGRWKWQWQQRTRAGPWRSKRPLGRRPRTDPGGSHSLSVRETHAFYKHNNTS